MEIIKIFDADSATILSQKSQEIPLTIDGLREAEIIAKQLIETLMPLMPAAGLAAPQIGISKRIFIYSWDRSLEHIEIAINPKIISASDDTTSSWEACFSTMQDGDTSMAGLVTRANSIVVEYANINGQIIRKNLSGFAAKVFQHEYDHMEGIENIRKENVEVKNFSTKADLMTFMKEVKKNDSAKYLEPIDIK